MACWGSGLGWRERACAPPPAVPSWSALGFSRLQCVARMSLTLREKERPQGRERKWYPPLRLAAAVSPLSAMRTAVGAPKYAPEGWSADASSLSLSLSLSDTPSFVERANHRTHKLLWFTTERYTHGCASRSSTIFLPQLFFVYFYVKKSINIFFSLRIFIKK